MKKNTLHTKISDLELGLKGDIFIAGKIEEKIYKKWGKKHKTSKSPFILFLGGMQGSGKTSVIQNMENSLDFVIISPDEIRAELFAVNFPITDNPEDAFRQTVNLIRNNLVKKALTNNYSIVVDQRMTDERIALLKKIASDYPHYKITTILLTAPEKVLKERIINREPANDRYRGTLKEFYESLAEHGIPNPASYDYTFDTSSYFVADVAKAIVDIINQLVS
jgi:predicted kinase